MLDKNFFKNLDLTPLPSLEDLEKEHLKISKKIKEVIGEPDYYNIEVRRHKDDKPDVVHSKVPGLDVANFLATEYKKNYPNFYTITLKKII